MRSSPSDWQWSCPLKKIKLSHHRLFHTIRLEKFHVFKFGTSGAKHQPVLLFFLKVEVEMGKEELYLGLRSHVLKFGDERN